MPAAKDCVMKKMEGPCGIDSDDRSWKTFESIISESFGTFVFVLFFMICTDEKLKYLYYTQRTILS